MMLDRKNAVNIILNRLLSLFTIHCSTCLVVKPAVLIPFATQTSPKHTPCQKKRNKILFSAVLNNSSDISKGLSFGTQFPISPLSKQSTQEGCHSCSPFLLYTMHSILLCISMSKSIRKKVSNLFVQTGANFHRIHINNPI